jgi:hypothetical protein
VIIKYKSIKLNYCRLSTNYDAICLSIDNNFYANKDIERDRKVIREIEEVLKQRALWKVEMILDKGSSVPVIKSTYLPDALKCE